MKISGFTFVRNAILFGYPIYESLHSLLPLCDEIIIAAGKSDDDTITYLKSLQQEKIRIIETEWDKSTREGGLIYSQQTNIALNECKGDWCIYLQADEVLHEDDYNLIIDEINTANTNPDIDALLFRYLHFYGSYEYIGTGRQWYRREIRAFKNKDNVISWGDAQGFRFNEKNKISKLKARQINARIYHYGWVRHPRTQNLKHKYTQLYYYQDSEFNINSAEAQKNFDYNSAYQLEKFNGKHPGIMTKKIESDREWTKYFDRARLKKKPLLLKLTDRIEKSTGWRIGEYKDFIVVK
ncbi:MAG: glycosyltransferase family 2 protein [Ignavibacteriae bacterium]|nr:glycosyltransferase family 2 protein [Ignavibacteriota bacterium]